jgi:SAM-dependent methyltransferase
VSAKTTIKKFIPDSLVEARSVLRRARPLAKRTCNLCGYSGMFRNAGRPIRLDAKCPQCGSLERHRLFWLWYQRQPDGLTTSILHFAPEPVLRQLLDKSYHGADYRTADLFMENVDLKLDLEKLDLPDDSVGTVIINHVLEHVNDAVALRELNRIIAPGGRLVCSVPLIEGWAGTYENPSVTGRTERDLHFGQWDHVRYYGHDFRDRVQRAGFRPVEEVTGTPEECLTYSLIRGEKVFIYTPE